MKVVIRSKQELELYEFLRQSPFMSESEIQRTLWGYNRSTSRLSNKKYADRLRRYLEKGLVKRVKANPANHPAQYFYFVPKDINVVCQTPKHALMLGLESCGYMRVEHMIIYNDKLEGDSDQSLKVVGLINTTPRQIQIIKETFNRFGYDLDKHYLPTKAHRSSWSWGTRFWVSKKY